MASGHIYKWRPVAVPAGKKSTQPNKLEAGWVYGKFGITLRRKNTAGSEGFNNLKPTCYVMHQPV